MTQSCVAYQMKDYSSSYLVYDLIIISFNILFIREFFYLVYDLIIIIIFLFSI